MGSLRDSFEIFFDNYGSTLRNLWDNFEATLEKKIGQLCGDFGQLWGNFETILGVHWDTFETTLDKFYTIFGPHSDYFVTIGGA